MEKVMKDNLVEKNPKRWQDMAQWVKYKGTRRKGFLGGSVVENLPANMGDGGSIPGWGRSMEKEMATHSSILAWEMLWTEEPGGVSGP